MDPLWLDRELADRLVAGVAWEALEYDPGTGLYCRDGEPFTGVAKARWRHGILQAEVNARKTLLLPTPPDGRESSRGRSEMGRL
jgi:hypothetical protein